MRGPNTARAGVLAAAMLFLGAVAALAPASSVAAECENEAVRKEQGSTFIAECRAYELVSPPEANVEYESAGPPAFLPEAPFVPEVVGSEDGERVSYFSYAPNAGDKSAGYYFLATRGTTGWSVADAVPPQQLPGAEEPGCEAGVYFAPGLTSDLLTDGGMIYEREGLRSVCASNEPGLAPDEPEGGFANIFRHDWATGSYETVNLTPSGVQPEDAVLEDATADQSRVLFAESAELVAGAPKGLDLYESAEGHVRLVTYLPDGQPTVGEIVDGHAPMLYEGHVVGLESGQVSAAPLTHAESASGESVFFTAGGSLYMREHASRASTATGSCSTSEPEGACTIQIDAKQGGSEEGGGTFLYASADGSRVFFMDERDLTAGATAASKMPDLYEYDVEAPEGQRLKDLTVHAGGAGVLGFTGASEDGSYLYFVAEGDLAGNAVAKRPNLYLDHEGALSFIATLNAEYDERDWATTAYGLDELLATSSPNGRYLAFDSVQQLTKYNNAPAKEGECLDAKYQGTGPCPEIFRYAAGERAVVCASCNPRGERPTGPAELEPVGRPAFGPVEAIYRVRELLEDGDLFFNSPDPLVESDTNGTYDVYEYSGGGPHLISGGTGEGISVFAEASANGEDVFFVTSQSLVAVDTGGSASMYDARVNGGFEAQSAEAAAPEACDQAKACRMPGPEPPVEAFGASSAFSGAGDLTPTETQLKKPQSGRARGYGKHRLTRDQKLRRALKRCRQRHGSKARRRCRTRARRRFGRHRRHGPHGHKHSRDGHKPARHGHRHGKHRKGTGSR